MKTTSFLGLILFAVISNIPVYADVRCILPSGHSVIYRGDNAYQLCRNAQQQSLQAQNQNNRAQAAIPNRNPAELIWQQQQPQREYLKPGEGLKQTPYHGPLANGLPATQENIQELQRQQRLQEYYRQQKIEAENRQKSQPWLLGEIQDLQRYRERLARYRENLANTNGNQSTRSTNSGSTNMPNANCNISDSMCELYCTGELLTLCRNNINSANKIFENLRGFQ